MIIWIMRPCVDRSGSVLAWLIALVAVLGWHQVAHARPAVQQHPSTIAAGLETIRIRANVYVIFGAGANVTVQIGEDGLVLVDSGSSEMADKLLGAVRSISRRPIRPASSTPVRTRIMSVATPWSAAPACH